MSTFTHTCRRVAALLFGALLAVGLSGGLAYANTAAHADGHAPAHSSPTQTQGGGGLATSRAQ
jgi:hypothetical protein